MKITTSKQNIPSGWQNTFVDDICYVMKGQGLSKKDIEPSGKNKCLLYGELFTTYNEVIENVKSRTNSNIGIPSVRGDILIPGSTTTVARDLAVASALNEDGVLLGGDINILRKKDNFYNPNFLAYYLTHYKKDEIGKLGQGSTIVHLYGSNIKKLEVVIPKNIKEQQKIAEILGAVDEDIAKTQEVIEATEKLKRGLMQQLFTRGIGHTKFKETKIGGIPEEWEIRTLDQLKVADSNISYGVVQPGPETIGGIPFVRGGDIKNGIISNSLRTISPEISNQYSRTILKGGELIVSLVGYPGECAVVPNEFIGTNIARQVGLVRLGKYINAFFVQQYLSSPFGKANLLGNLVGSAQQVINLNLLRKVLIPLPHGSEQQKIADILSAVDEKISVNKKLKEKLTLLKKGLMQDLLSGKKRV